MLGGRGVHKRLHMPVSDAHVRRRKVQGGSGLTEAMRRTSLERAHSHWSTASESRGTAASEELAPS